MDWERVSTGASASAAIRWPTSDQWASSTKYAGLPQHPRHPRGLCVVPLRAPRLAAHVRARATRLDKAQGFYPRALRPLVVFPLPIPLVQANG
jgi:hypothetical protein